MSATESQTKFSIDRAKGQANFLKQVRRMHLYLGTFFAPSIIFFALTGAVQLFGLHESRPGNNYQPPAWIEKLAQIHKKQTLATRHDRPPAGSMHGETGERRPEPGRERPQPERSRSALLLKFFFLLMALGLIWTTCLGIYMSFKYNRSKKVVWGLLLVGTALPLFFLLIQ